MRRVVVTGIGVLSPLANTAEETWQNLLLGKSGIDNIEHFDTTDYSTKFAGLLKGFDAHVKKLRKWISLFNMVLPRVYKLLKTPGLKFQSKMLLALALQLALVLVV